MKTCNALFAPYPCKPYFPQACLSGVSIKEHIKTSFFWVWGISAICLVSGAMLGIISL